MISYGLDFSKCATTIEAAHRLNRKWIGIDIAIHAIKRVAAVRLAEGLRLVEGQDYTIEGVPRNVEGAQLLWERDKYHFQKWAIELAEGFVTNRRTADGGIDGRNFPKMQLMTVEELLEGKRFNTPPVLGRQQIPPQQLVF